jgi:hypothetical protein
MQHSLALEHVTPPAASPYRTSPGCGGSIGAVTRAATSQRVGLTASGATVANVYSFKPIDLDQYIGIVHAIEGFWFSVVKLPQMDKRKDLA